MFKAGVILAVSAPYWSPALVITQQPQPWLRGCGPGADVVVRSATLSIAVPVFSDHLPIEQLRLESCAVRTVLPQCRLTSFAAHTAGIDARS